MGRPRIKPEDRFIIFVNEVPGGCWEWKGSVDSSGHGRFRLPDRTVFATRWLWEHVIGPLPEDKQMCHICDNSGCVNLAHVYPGTAQSNSDDKFERNRQRFLKGSEHPSTKVHDEETEEIQRLYQGGTSVKEIAQRYGVHIMTIYRRLK